MDSGRGEADFRPKTRELIARRAGYKCSFPQCARLTVGPAKEPSKSACKGVAAHMFAAAGRGPRGTGGLSDKERKSPENGIWLCEDHASLIDKNDGKDYPPGLLLSYKALHEARMARELGGNYTPLGWLQSMKVRSSPVFADTAEMSFGKLTLLIGENDTGKSALCQWLASIASVKPLERWQQTYKSERRVSIDVSYLHPEPHTASVSFINEGGWPRYELDGRFTAVPATPVRIIFPGRLQFSDYDGEVDDLKLMAEILNLHPYEVLALCDEMPSKGTDNVSRLWFEQEELGRVMHGDVKGTIPGLPFRGLSGSECQRIVMELAIVAASKLAEMYPTVIILDQAWPLHADWLKHYGEVLSSPEFGFQTVAAIPMRDINFDELRWAGWKVVRLKGKAPGVTVSEDVRIKD